MNATALALEGKIEEPAAAPVAMLHTPQQMLSAAVLRGADLATIEKLMDLQDRFEASQAKKAFKAAFSAFKADPPIVYKNKLNKQYDSFYSTLDNLVNSVNAALAAHGLTTSWDIKQEQQIEVTCILAHVDGHSERVTMRGDKDNSGSKNALQQIKSTTTYLKGATFEAVTGIASAERVGVNRDDDGNKSQPPQSEAEKAEARRLACMDAAKRHENAVAVIQDRIAKYDDTKDPNHLYTAGEAWREIPQADQEALWLAPSKGGILTTHQRETLKTKLPRP